MNWAITDAADGERIFVRDDATEAFASRWAGDTSWGVIATATAIAFGDPDGDGLDELAVTRNHNINARVFLYDDRRHDAARLWAAVHFGEGWGRVPLPRGGFGNIDDDPAEEIGSDTPGQP